MDVKIPSRLAQHRGQDLVEYAIVLPVLILLLLGVMEFGIVVYSYNAISNAAREGARFAVVVPNQTHITPITQATCPGVNPIVQRTCSMAIALRPADLRVSVTPNSSNRTVTVRVDYTARLITAPVIQAVGGSGTLALRAVSTMRLE